MLDVTKYELVRLVAIVEDRFACVETKSQEQTWFDFGSVTRYIDQMGTGQIVRFSIYLGDRYVDVCTVTCNHSIEGQNRFNEKCVGTVVLNDEIIPDVDEGVLGDGTIGDKKIKSMCRIISITDKAISLALEEFCPST